MKIVEVVNTMITHSDKIENVIKSENEYFFIYNKKYKWSISEYQGDYFLHIYPDENISLEDLAQISDWERYANFVTFKVSEIKTREATESFSELYQIITSKLLGVDDILNDILNDV